MNIMILDIDQMALCILIRTERLIATENIKSLSKADLTLQKSRHWQKESLVQSRKKNNKLNTKAKAAPNRIVLELFCFYELSFLL